MSSFERIMKYIAIALAIFLIIIIITGVIGASRLVFNIIGIDKNDNRNSKIVEDLVSIYGDMPSIDDISSLKIEIKGATLKVVESESFDFKTNNSDIEFSNENGNIYIIEKSKDDWFLNNNFESEVIVYLPREIELLKKVDISLGAGKIDIDKLFTEELKIEVGAGSFTIENLDVTNKAKIEGGAGEICINSGSINNLELESGIGKTKVKANILGNSKIESGIGYLVLNLMGSKEEYSLNIEKGIGVITLNQDNIPNNTSIGNGNNNIKIEGGIGKIEITTNE